MRVVLLCGGAGTRLREETEFRPKPMVEIGGKPILWHIMSHYARYGHDDFVLCLGYKGELIRNYFVTYPAMNTDVRVHIGSQRIEYLEPLKAEANWKVTLVETGLTTLTGGRLLRASRYLAGSTFLCTYGDGLSSINLDRLLAFHRKAGKLATVTGVRPASRFGTLEVHEGIARSFSEKPRLEEGWINGGFFVLEPEALDYIRHEDADVMFERGPLQRLAADKQLAVYEHEGYWMPMDTYRDVVALNEEWNSGNPGWLRSD